MVIPAHPLALTAARRLDERRQIALTRYYCDAGAGGIAVGVHTTQFAIRDPGINLLKPVLALAHRTVREWCADRDQHPAPHCRGLRPDCPGGPRSAARGVARLRCRPAEPGGAPRRGQRPRHRSLPAGGRRPAARRVLSSACRGRPRPRSGLLAPVPRDRPRRRDQSRPLRPVSHARRRHRAGRERPGRRGAVHRKRRRDCRRPVDAVPRRRSRPAAALFRRAARSMGRLDEPRRRAAAAVPGRHGR